MTQPAPYTRSFSFTDFATAKPAEQMPGSAIDAELDGVGETLGDVLASLAKLQRDDGALKNGAVGIEQLSSAVLAFVRQDTFSVRGQWATATSYLRGDFYSNDNKVYVVVADHVGSTIAADIAAGKVVGPVFYPDTAQVAALKAELAATTGAASIGTSTGGTVEGDLAVLKDFKAALAVATAASGAKQVGAFDYDAGAKWTTAQGFIDRVVSQQGSASVGFVQSGAGAVPRTLQDKARELGVSVKDYGATGDGAASNTAAFTAALASSTALSIPDGTYNLDGSVSVTGSRSWKNLGVFTGAGGFDSTTDYSGFNYSADFKNVRVVEGRGTAAGPVADKDAVGVFSKHSSVSGVASAQNPALVAQHYKRGSSAHTVAQGVFAEAIDKAGNASGRTDFVEGGRFHGIGMGGNAYGVVALGQVGDGVTVPTAKYAVAFEGEVIRSGGIDAVAPLSWTSANNLDAMFLATVRYGQKPMAGFMLNPFNEVQTRCGFLVGNSFAAQGLDRSLVTFAAFATIESGVPYGLFARNVNYAVISGPNNVPLLRALNAAGDADHNLLSYGTDNTVTVGSEASGVRIKGNTIFNPPSSTSPGSNGEVVLQATSDTALDFKFKGSDGTIRTFPLIPGTSGSGVLSDLAANTGAGLVGRIDSGSGAVARTVQDKLRDLPTNEDFASGTARGFWTDSTPAGRVWRPLDRVFFGGAATGASGLSNPGTAKGWLGFEANGYMTYLETTSQVQSWSTKGGPAFAAASRASDLTGSPSESQPIGYASYVTNDKNGATSNVWGFYAMSNRAPGVAGGAIGAELDVANQGAEVQINPFDMGAAGGTMAAWLRTGGEVSESGATVAAASAALGITRDSSNANAKFLKGIVFDANAFKPDGAGNGIAMQLALKHEIQWVRDGSVSRSGWVRSDATADSVGIVFSNGGLVVQNQANQTAFGVQANSNTVNYLRIDGSPTSTGPALNAVGNDTNIDIILNPKGSGELRINKTFGTGTLTPDAYFVVKDVNGSTFRVPCQYVA